MTPWEKLRALERFSCQLFITVNPQAVDLASVADYLAEQVERGCIDADDVPAGCEGWSSLCKIQCYPDTTVGSWLVLGATIEACLDQISEPVLASMERAYKWRTEA